MVFWAKCLICILLVCVALEWRPIGASSQGVGTVAKPQPPRRPRLEDATRSLVQAGSDALVSAARDKCLAAPRDCAAALQRFQPAAAR